MQTGRVTSVTDMRAILSELESRLTTDLALHDAIKVSNALEKRLLIYLQMKYASSRAICPSLSHVPERILQATPTYK